MNPARQGWGRNVERAVLEDLIRPVGRVIMIIERERDDVAAKGREAWAQPPLPGIPEADSLGGQRRE